MVNQDGEPGSYMKTDNDIIVTVLAFSSIFRVKFLLSPLNIFPWKKNVENKYIGNVNFLYCLRTFNSATEGKKINGTDEAHTSVKHRIN